jgi:hypothetical protein
MPFKFDIWLEVAATAAAVLLIPIYMGFIHVAPVGAAAYAGVGGGAMAVGEEVQFGARPTQVTFSDVVLWAMAICGVGGVGYFLALAFI